MSPLPLSTPRHPRLPSLWRDLPAGLLLLFLAALAVTLGLQLLQIWHGLQQTRLNDQTLRLYELSQAVERVLGDLRDAETGQRGFLITRQASYRQPYEQALTRVPADLARLRAWGADDPELDPALIRAFESVANRKLAELRETIAAADADHFDRALEILRSDRGRELMETARRQADLMLRRSQDRLAAFRARLRRGRLLGPWLEGGAMVASTVLLGWVCWELVRQIVQNRRTAAERQRLNERLEAANGELRAFAYSVAHDLRAPLRAIDGFSSVLLEDHGEELSGPAKHLLGRIVVNGTRMGELIEDLLSLSRVSMASLESRRIPMTSLVQEVCQELVGAERREHGDREIEVRLDEAMPPAWGDPSLVRQVWVNLIGNALKFTRYTRPARIDVGGAAAGPAFVTYYVRDNGAGFDMRYLNKLFQPFQRLHRENEFEGTGVGLALVQRVVQRHGGVVWAEGKVGEGARFAFTLPEWKEPEAGRG